MKSFGLLLLLSSSSLEVTAKLGESHVQMSPSDASDQRALQALQFHGSNPSFKLGRCEGDCDSDNDCNSSDLTCFQRTAPFIEVPGCSGGSSDSSLSDYCIRRIDLNGGGGGTGTVQVAQSSGQQKAIEWSTNFPLKLCQGDCDSDFDCQGGLVCFQRNEKQAVPGCLGGEHDWSLTDYCVPKGWNNPNAPPPQQPQPQTGGGDLPIAWSNVFPLNRCEGDCDSDIDCQGNLKCFQRNGGTPVPGCIGGKDDSSNVDYCYDDGSKQGPPASTPAVQNSNNNNNNSNNPPPRVATFIGDQDFSAYPLGECQGDCDNNMDCLPGMFCWQRNEGEQMPYCVGAAGGIDYCIPESESPGKKLKMYWDNYFWQETYEEAFWCMTCTKCDSLTVGDGWEGGCKDPPADKCEEGHLIWIQKCKEVRKRFDILQNPGSGDQIKVHGTNLCFSTRDNRFLELRPCDKNKSNQLWVPMNNRKKFEIRPWNQRHLSSKDASCVSQLHHPKATEVLSMKECWLNIHYETNYWTEYY